MKSRSIKRSLIAVAVLGFATTFTPVLFADVAAVNKYLDDAKALIDQGPNSFEDATAKLDLAEGSMDDVSAADKPALEAKIKAFRDQISSAGDANDKKSLEEKIKGAIEEAEGAVGNLATWPGASERLTGLLDDPTTAKLLGADELAGFKKQFATFQKVNAGKSLKQFLVQDQANVESVEKEWADIKTEISAPDMSPEGKDQAIGHFPDRLKSMQDRLNTDLPDDSNADVKALKDRLVKIQNDINSTTSANTATAELDNINRFLDTYKDNFAGMDAETKPATLQQFRQGGDAGEAFGAKKTAEYVSRVGDFLKDLPKNEDYTAAKDNPAVKAKVDELTAKVAAGQAKLAKFAESVAAEAQAQKPSAETAQNANSVADRVNYYFGKDSDESKKLVPGLEKFEADFKNAGVAADAAKDAYYKNMTEQANKAWPDMLAKYDIVSPFDPNEAASMKGKFIRITGDNLMGYRFKPTDFPYATTLNGIPVAGKYDPAVRAALAEVEAKLGRAIGDDDNDGKWIAVCRVEGTMGKLVQLVNHEGDVKVDGEKVGTVTGTEEKTVDAPIVTIVALKAGPVAVSAGQGAVKEDGSIGKPVVPSGSAAPVGGALASAGGSSSGGHHIGFFGIFIGLVGILVGAASLMKAKFAPLATNAGAVQLTEKVGGQNIQYLGLAGIVLGGLGVLWNLIALPGAFFYALIGLIASVAMVVAGAVASREFFEERKVLPANLAPVLTQYAVPAGLVCAAMGLLTVLFSIV